MRNLLYSVIASLAMSLFFYSNCRANEPDEKLHTQCLYPTVHIMPESKQNYGSGFIVRSSKISENEYLNVFITAAHIIKSHEQHIVRVFEYEEWSLLKRAKSFSSTIYAMDSDRDIAIGMFVSDEKLPTVVIDMAAKLYIGNEVFHVGCGFSEDPRLDYGKITSLRSKIGGAGDWMLRTSVFSIPGDSGGPLFYNYRVIGLLKSIRLTRNGQYVFNMSYYTPITCLRDWSEEENGAYDFVWKERAFPRMPLWELHFSRDYTIAKLP